MKFKSTITLLSLTLGVLCFFALISDAMSWSLQHESNFPRLRSLAFIIPTKSRSKTLSKEAQALLTEGNNVHILSDKIKFYCRSLSKAGSAVIEDPYNTRYLLNWANIRQLLGRTPCTESLTDGDVVEALDMALMSSPKEPSVLYSAGLIYLWSNKKEKARELFGDVLRFSLSLTQGQQAIVLNSIEKPEDIPVVIPGKFPHVITWQQPLMQLPALQKDVETANRTIAAIGNLQLESLMTNRTELDRGIIQTDVFEQRLLELLSVTTNSQARRFIDGEFSTSVYPDSDLPEHRFFLNRSGLSEYQLVRSFIPLDTRPQKSSLSRWGRNDRINFAGSYNTIGFYVPNSRPVRLVSLQSRSLGTGPETSQIEVYVSLDNSEWINITDKIRISQLRVIDYQWMALTLTQPVRAPYWKIHLSGTEKTRQFVNYLNEIVRAFGPPEEDEHDKK